MAIPYFSYDELEKQILCFMQIVADMVVLVWLFLHVHVAALCYR
jgi:hypothetical protein